MNESNPDVADYEALADDLWERAELLEDFEACLEDGYFVPADRAVFLAFLDLGKDIPGDTIVDLLVRRTMLPIEHIQRVLDGLSETGLAAQDHVQGCSQG